MMSKENNTPPEETQVCTHCEIEKPISDFTKNYRHSNGRQYKCRQCFSAYNRGYGQTPVGRANKAKGCKKWQREQSTSYKASVRKKTLKQKYGLTPEDLSAMIGRQMNCCLGCGIGMTACGGRKQIRQTCQNIDHDHNASVPVDPVKNPHGIKVRGVLCAACNSALGAMKDSASRLRRLANFLDVSGTVDRHPVPLEPLFY